MTNDLLRGASYPVSIDSRLYDYITVSCRWRNDGGSVVAFCECDGQQQALLLLTQAGEFVTTAGVWHISDSSGRGAIAD